MRIKKTLFDKLIITLLLVSPIAPVSVSKILVIVSLSLIILRFVLLNNIIITRLKLLIITLILPGIFLTTVNSPKDLIRFAIIFILILGAPKFDFLINKKYIMNFCSLILIYLISTQIFIAIDNDLLISFRANWYPNEFAFIWSEVNQYEKTTASSILTQIGQVRAGGIFHNPNVLASVIVLYFFIFVILYDNLKVKKNYMEKLYFIFIFILVVLSLSLTFSRTYLVSIILFYLLRESTSINFQKLTIKFRHLFIFPIIFIIAYLLFDAVTASFYKIGGSMNIKISVISTYLKFEDIFTLFFGGRYGVFFDMEYGYWIGSIGFVGIIGLIFLFRNLYIENKILRLYFITFLFMSLGNSLFYGLLTAVIALNMIIISSSLNMND
jgi:hypothetical protein